MGKMVGMELHLNNKKVLEGMEVRVVMMVMKHLLHNIRMEGITVKNMEHLQLWVVHRWGMVREQLLGQKIFGHLLKERILTDSHLMEVMEERLMDSMNNRLIMANRMHIMGGKGRSKKICLDVCFFILVLMG